MTASQSLSFPSVGRAPGDLATLLYTTGRTDRSNGAMLSQNNLFSNAKTLVGIGNSLKTTFCGRPLKHPDFIAESTALMRVFVARG